MDKIVRFTPAPGFVLVRPTDRDKSSELDIAGAKDEKEESRQGEVVSVGEHILHQSGKLIFSPVDKKDRIVFRLYGSETLYLENVKYLIVPFDGVRGVLK